MAGFHYCLRPLHSIRPTTDPGRRAQQQPGKTRIVPFSTTLALAHTPPCTASSTSLPLSHTPSSIYTVPSHPTHVAQASLPPGSVCNARPLARSPLPGPFPAPAELPQTTPCKSRIRSIVARYSLLRAPATHSDRHEGAPAHAQLSPTRECWREKLRSCAVLTLLRSSGAPSRAKSTTPPSPCRSPFHRKTLLPLSRLKR